MVSAQKTFVKKTSLEILVKPEHWDNVQKVEEALAELTKYKGDQLCADGAVYIELYSPTQALTINNQPLTASNKAALKEVSLGKPGVLLSANATSSMAASVGMNITMSI